MNTTAPCSASRCTTRKSATSASSLPISRKAYLRFTDRINRVYGPDTSGATAMLTALDRYLSGDHSADDTLPLSAKTAFTFLRQEIDMAIERSRKARERARIRRATPETATLPAPAENVQAVTTPTLPETASGTNDIPSGKPPHWELVYETAPTYEVLKAMTQQQPLTTMSRKDRRALERKNGKKRNKPLCPKPSR